MAGLETAPQRTAHLEAVGFGHHQVGDDHLRTDPLHGFQAFRTTRSDIHVKFGGQVLFQIIAEIPVVVDDHHGIGLAGTAVGPLAPGHLLHERIDFLLNEDIGVRCVIFVRGLALREGQGNGERDPAVGRASADLPAQLRHQLFDDGQTQARTALELGFKSLVQIGRSRIGDTHADAWSLRRAGRSDVDRNETGEGGVLDGVAEQVREYLLDDLVVEHAVIRLELGLEFHLDALAVSIQFEQGEDALQETHQFPVARVQREMPAFNLAESQQLPDHPLHPGHATFDEPGIFRSRRILRDMFLELPQRIHDQGKRGLEVVGDAGKEILFHLLQFHLFPVHLPVGEIAPDEDGDAQQQKKIDQLGPPRKERGRPDRKCQARDVVPPKAVVVGGPHFKTVVPGFQVVVTHGLLTGRQHGPAVVQAGQPAGITVVLRAQITVRRESQVDVRLVVPKVQRDLRADVPLGGQALVVHPDVGEKHAGFPTIGLDLGRIDHDEAVCATKKQFSPGSQEGGAYIESAAVAGIVDGGHNKTAIPETVQTVVGTHPDIAGDRIFQDSEDRPPIHRKVLIAAVRMEDVHTRPFRAEQDVSAGSAAIAAKVVDGVGLVRQIDGPNRFPGNRVEKLDAGTGDQPKISVLSPEKGFHVAAALAAHHFNFSVLQVRMHQVGVRIAHPKTALAVRQQFIHTQGRIPGATRDGQSPPSTCPGIESLDAGVEERHPESAFVINPEFLHQIGYQTAPILLGIIGKLIPLPVPNGDAATFRPDPQATFRILAEAAHDGMPQAAGAGLEPILDIAVPLRGKGQLAPIRAYPYGPFRTGTEGPDGIARKGEGILQVGPQQFRLSGIRTDEHEAILRPHPDNAVPMLVQLLGRGTAVILDGQRETAQDGSLRGTFVQTLREGQHIHTFSRIQHVGDWIGPEIGKGFPRGLSGG